MEDPAEETDFRMGFDAFEGTYLRVVPLKGFDVEDEIVVLYLRPNQTFLFLAYWSGYERSQMAGYWSKADTQIHLRGVSLNVKTDSLPAPAATDTFERTFDIEEFHGTPALVAPAQASGWSMLGWSGPYLYVGYDTAVATGDRWLPKSIGAVDEWIRQSLPAEHPT